MSRVVKAPRKKIHDALTAMGFGYDPKHKYYHVYLKNKPITLSVFFTKIENKYEISIGVYYPEATGYGGFCMNPERLTALKPSGKLLQGIDFTAEAESECWNIEQLLNTEKLCKLICYWSKVLSNPQKMNYLNDYLLGLNDECPQEFSDIDITYSDRGPIPARLWCKAVYLALEGNFHKSNEVISKLPEWAIDNKVVQDCTGESISISPDLDIFMRQIKAGVLNYQ